MKLTLEQMQSITLGAHRVALEEGKLRFHRFTEEEERFYQHRDDTLGRSFLFRCKAPAGMRLSFLTDSRTLKIAATVGVATSRSYFSFDVFEDGAPVGYLDNFGEEKFLGNFTEVALPLGTFEKTFSLREGESRVSVYLPWSVVIEDMTLELDDGATLTPVRPEKKYLVYGDSITQGYDALRPSHRYAARLSDLFGAEEINKANGGEIFVPPLAAMKVDFAPDYITVAYGTNDWSTTDGESFLRDAKRFYSTLSSYYPEAKIFAITPIWRANFEEEKPFGTFAEVEARIREATKGLPNVTVLSSFELVGHDMNLFADLRLHPRDEGFDEYFENLSKKIGEYI